MKCFICFFVSLPIFISCSTSSYKFTSDKPITVSLVSIDKLDTVGEVLGKTPLDLEKEKIKQKIVKFSGDGKIPQYWVFVENMGDKLAAKVQLQDAPNSESSSLDYNTAFRMLMKAYQALARKDYKTAEELAKSLSNVNQKVAAPKILLGLIYLKKGDNSSARSQFKIAKALDPSDSEIESLINLAN